MASVETAAPPQLQATMEPQIKWSLKLTRCMSGMGAIVVKNHGKVDVTLRLFLFVFSVITVVVTVSAKQTTMTRVSPTMTMRVQAEFSHLAALTYFVAAFSTISLYSIITGYKSYSALKKQKPSSINQHLHMVLLDTLILSIASSATGAGLGVSYQALKGNPHTHWMKLCNIFGTFCHHLVAAGAMSLLASVTLLMLVWFTVTAIVKNSGR